jgi:hypothetical protein
MALRRAAVTAWALAALLVMVPRQRPVVGMV